MDHLLAPSSNRRTRTFTHGVHEDVLFPMSSYGFDGLWTRYIHLFDVVAPFIATKVQSVEDIKTYLQRVFPEVIPNFANAESFDDVMSVIYEKCTIINIYCLEVVVDHFKIIEAKEFIVAYKSTVDEFCHKIKLSECVGQSFKKESASPHLLTCETIIFVLEWSSNDYTLIDIVYFLHKTFTDKSKKVQVRSIKDLEANSIIVTCFAPQNMMDILLVETKINLELLKRMGLFWLKIGYHTIWDKLRRDKVRDEYSTRQLM